MEGLKRWIVPLGLAIAMTAGLLHADSSTTPFLSGMSGTGKGDTVVESGRLRKQVIARRWSSFRLTCRFY